MTAREVMEARVFTWHDLLYLIALLIGVLLVAGHALGLGDLGSGGAGSALPELGLDAEGAPFAEDGVLDLLGLGRVPLSVLSLTCCLIFGGSGLALGPVAGALFGSALGPWLGLALAVSTALAGTAVLGRLFARHLPLLESYASRKQELLGLAGRVIVCGPSGEATVAVIDDGGAELRIRALIEPGPGRAGARVAISGYDPALDLFLVLELPEHGSQSSASPKPLLSKERERS